jgi:hypothetical protein
MPRHAPISFEKALDVPKAPINSLLTRSMSAGLWRFNADSRFKQQLFVRKISIHSAPASTSITTGVRRCF